MHPLMLTWKLLRAATLCCGLSVAAGATEETDVPTDDPAISALQAEVETSENAPLSESAFVELLSRIERADQAGMLGRAYVVRWQGLLGSDTKVAAQAAEAGIALADKSGDDLTLAGLYICRGYLREMAEQTDAALADYDLAFDAAKRAGSIGGCVSSPGHGPSETRIGDLLKRVDLAMYRAKRGGRNRVEFDAASWLQFSQIGVQARLYLISHALVRIRQAISVRQRIEVQPMGVAARVATSLVYLCLLVVPVVGLLGYRQLLGDDAGLQSVYSQQAETRTALITQAAKLPLQTVVRDLAIAAQDDLPVGADRAAFARAEARLGRPIPLDLR